MENKERIENFKVQISEEKQQNVDPDLSVVPIKQETPPNSDSTRATSHVTVMTEPSVMPLEQNITESEKGVNSLVSLSARYAAQHSSVTEQPKEEVLDECDWIDKTNQPLGEIGNGYVLPPHLVTLCLTNNRLKEITNLEEVPLLEDLILRQNAISEIKGLGKLPKLKELDLYMNQIESVPSTAFKENPYLKRVDLGFNRIRSIETFPSEYLESIEELFLLGNKINSIKGLYGMPNLKMLELGDNRIREIQNLDNLASLEGLWLGRNKVTQIRNLDTLVNLRRLSLQSNRIVVIEQLNHLENLEELYLSHNGIKSMGGLNKLLKLKVLDLGTNFIEHIEGIEELHNLTEFWINDNKLSAFEELLILSGAPELETIYLEGNPLAKDDDYEKKALDALPDSLEQLDALLVSDVRKNIAAKDKERELRNKDIDSEQSPTAPAAIENVPAKDQQTEDEKVP